ncbi:sushi, von Willebrand factor type A, EGF and pentraxin domain-containing protein 1-like isoform X2 [Alosa alosa]|uniref:sushi, von Willebrand factor type A, EGF and pentraxin domain-containing protein 1-like isoform X2 n=1 Tax=Alosa alosa TaxID=278164 RepID=UPI0020151355|nr:sushi, von Willebrand factor type A, EGF and pentraxin domain-containing protein 1-like isoform X2 [Alosa alosa]
MQFIKNILGSLWILLLLPSEIKGQCTKPPASDNAVVHEDYILKDTFEEESTIRLRCYPGYQPSSGLSRLTCSSGQWSPSPESFICRKKSCGNPGEVTNGEYQFPDGIEFGAEIIAVCNIGFQIIGKNKRTCQANGEWNGREAVCEAVTCAPPPPVTNGLLKLPSEEYYHFGDVVQYTCSNGYSLFGENNVHCLVHGNWSEKPRCTKVDCPRPDIPNAKRIEGHSGPYTLRNRVIYECVKGYRMMTPNNQMVCLEEGWSHKLTCEEVECPQPGASNAIIIAGAGGPYRYGSFVRYECQIGHRLVGSSQLECGSDGQWSSNPPMCEEVKCPLPRVTNATITEGAGGSYGYGTVVRYKCPAEQKLVGSPQLKCESNGQWSSNPPVCLKVVECPQPGASNAIIIAGAGGPYRYGFFVRYECQIGHRLVGSSQLECGSDGQWSSNPPMCEEVKCPQPRVTNATITEGAGGSYGYGTVVRYKCPAEQKLVGSPQLKCESNGQWSSNPPVCLKEVKCPQPRVTNATISEGAGGSYGYGTVVGYKCPAEQKLVGSPQLKCESNGQWSSNPPVCLIESTPPPFSNLIAFVLLPALFFVAGGLIWIFIRYKKKKKNRSSPTPSHSESVQLKSLNTPENGV